MKGTGFVTSTGEEKGMETGKSGQKQHLVPPAAPRPSQFACSGSNMLINSVHTAEDRKETGFFHWFKKKRLQAKVPKKKKKLRRRESLIPTWNTHLEIHYENVLCLNLVLVKKLWHVVFQSLLQILPHLTTLDSSTWGTFLFST